MSLQKKLDIAKAEQTETMCNLFEEVLRDTKGIGPKKIEAVMQSLRNRANGMRG